DELERGMVAHAIRFTIRNSRRAYVYPATHFASNKTDANLPRMGERFRLRPDFDTSGFSPHAQAILKGLKKYGMFVADNGGDWRISVAPDGRIKGLDDLRRVRGRDFEVVQPGERPRAECSSSPAARRVLQPGTQDQRHQLCAAAPQRDPARRAVAGAVLMTPQPPQRPEELLDRQVRPRLPVPPPRQQLDPAPRDHRRRRLVATPLIPAQRPQAQQRQRHHRHQRDRPPPPIGARPPHLLDGAAGLLRLMILLDPRARRIPTEPP